MRAKKEDINPGDRFGRLIVLGIIIEKRTMLICECDCGEYKKASMSDIISGKTQSCGCLNRETTIKRNKEFRCITHGESGTKAYQAYADAKTRCNCVNNDRYWSYGGRGIEFRYISYEHFIEDVGYPEDDDLSLDRIDNDGNYEPGNCRWATRSQQQSNKRNSRR